MKTKKTIECKKCNGAGSVLDSRIPAILITCDVCRGTGRVAAEIGPYPGGAGGDDGQGQ